MSNKLDDKDHKHEGHEDHTNIQIDRQHYKGKRLAMSY